MVRPSLASAWSAVTIRCMYAIDTILTYGFPLGRLGGARFRVSFLFPVVAVALTWRFRFVELGLEYALLATGILLFSVLLHELAHLVIARSTGGEMDDVLLWPLGGLEEPYGRGYWQDHLQTMLAGPVTNLLLAASCLLIISGDDALRLLNPLTPFYVLQDESLLTSICRLAFVINVCLFAINMIPVTPFDSGVLLRTYLTSRFTEPEGRDLMIRLGLIFGLLGMLTGIMFDFAAVVAVSAFVMILHLHESVRWFETTDRFDDQDELEYSYPVADEFGEAFEDDGEFFRTEVESDGGHQEVLDRWRHQREQERVREEREAQEREEQQVDRILQKIHLHGRESLSSNDLHLLKQVSDRYRDRQQHH